MSYQSIRVTREGRVGVITLHRPEARNALNTLLIGELAAAVEELERDEGLGALVLAGGERYFAAGADIREMAAMDFREVFEREFSGCCDRVASCRLPIVAAVAGYALGGGCELVEMCDVVVAADNAMFGHPEITLGSLPGAGSTQRLARAIGKHKALDLYLTARTMGADEAERAGLVSRIVPPERVLPTALEIAQRIAGFSRPVAMLVKEAVNHAFSSPLAEGVRFERRLFHTSFTLADRTEGMQAFIEKREPQFKHR
ncbi:MAG TPA: enoyl-CoA hydratase-related protein [bacterium]|nr:enoyl-CoA hydratase-related protein [bacterium]